MIVNSFDDDFIMYFMDVSPNTIVEACVYSEVDF
jgi:hypothetical protein